MRQGGFRNLYFGVIPPVVIRGFSFSLQRATIYVGNGVLDRVCSPTTREWMHRTSADQALLGSLAGSLTLITDCPIHLLKCRAQTTKVPGEHTETLRTYYRTAVTMYRNHGGGFAGIRSLYLGAQPCLKLKFFSWGMLYWAYDVMRQQGYGPLVAGAVSAVVAWPLFYPLDVLRTRIQTADPKLGLTCKDHYERFWRLPVRQWFPGLSLTIARTAPRFGITFFTLEAMQSIW